MSGAAADTAAGPRRMAGPEVALAASAAGRPAAALLSATGELVACTADWAEATGIPPRRRLVDAIRPDDLPALLGALGRTDRRLQLAVRAGRGDAAVETVLCLDGAWLDGRRLDGTAVPHAALMQGRRLELGPVR